MNNRKTIDFKITYHKALLNLIRGWFSLILVRFRSNSVTKIIYKGNIYDLYVLPKLLSFRVIVIEW